MRLKRLGEFGAIERIRQLTRHPGRGVRVGIGDDAAALVPSGGLTLASADMMVEGVHFDLGYTSFDELGYRALASNLSDIAAMGGKPLYYIVCMALSPDDDEAALEGLYQGLEAAAGPFGVRLIGGDTTSTTGARTVAVTIIGEAGPGGPVRRSGAKPGDDIYVTGTLGDSAAGLELLKSGVRAIMPPYLFPSPPAGEGGRRPGGGDFRTDRAGAKAGKLNVNSVAEGEKYLVSRHLRPEPRVKAGMLLAGLAASMIDISDGLSSDLGHILDASSVGARIYADRVPLSVELVAYAGAKRSLKLALHGGEDYELLFTARPGRRKKVEAAASQAGARISLIGETTPGKGGYLVAGDGSSRELSPGGYEHFRK